MTDLSPAAQAVHEAAWSAYWIKDAEAPQDAELIAAAALKAVAMEVVLNKYQYADWQMADMIMKEIQAIADELENYNG
jgi:hypothetical protein